MTQPQSQQLDALLASLRPVLHPGVYVFCAALPSSPAVRDAIATFRESEGLTLVVEESVALAAGLQPRFRAAWLTLTVNSDLQAVGLTAAVARRLADADIACNVIAAVNHDHLFVPVERGEEALGLLNAVTQRTRTAPSPASPRPRRLRR